MLSGSYNRYRLTARDRSTELSLSDLGLELAQQPDGMADFGFLTGWVLGDLTLDGQRAGVAHLFQRSQVVFHPHVAVPQRHFDAPFLAGAGGPLAILAVDTTDVAADLLQRRNRLAGAIQDHVGRVEVDEQVVAAHVGDELQQPVGRLLAGLQVQALPVAAAVVAYVGGDGHNLAVERVARVVRHEAQVQGNDAHTQEACEIRDLLELVHAGSTGLRRHQADGARDGRDIGIAFSLKAGEHGRDADLGRLEPREEVLRGGWRTALALGSVQVDGRYT